jgi:hypothetical protein
LYWRQSNNRGPECISVAVLLHSSLSSFCWLGFSKTTNPGAPPWGARCFSGGPVRGLFYAQAMDKAVAVEPCLRCSAAMEWRHGTWQCPRCRLKLGCCEGEPQRCDHDARIVVRTDPRVESHVRPGGIPDSAYWL